jgi:hypothetical protein
VTQSRAPGSRCSSITATWLVSTVVDDGHVQSAIGIIRPMVGARLALFSWPAA